MSLLQILIEPNRARVGVDTQAVCLDPAGNLAPHLALLGLKHGQRFETSKLLPLVHADTVLAARGNPGFLGNVYAMLCMKPLVDFDAIDAAMPELLRWVHAAMAPQCHPSLKDVFEEQEVAVVGWSSRKRRMDGTVYSKNREGGFEDFEIPSGGWAVPWNDDEQGGPPMQIKGHAEMEILAREQVRYLRTADPAKAIGGRLIVAELTRHSIAITSTELG